MPKTQGERVVCTLSTLNVAEGARSLGLKSFEPVRAMNPKLFCKFSFLDRFIVKYGQRIARTIDYDKFIPPPWA